MKWVKAYTGLLDNDAFKLCSKDARDTFLYGLLVAGKQDQDGAFAIRAVGPMSPEQISEYTRIPVKRQIAALEELERVGAFLYRRQLDNAWAISQWDEKAGPEAAAESNRERQQRYRDRHRNGVSNALRNAEIVTDREEEGDKEKEVEGELPRARQFATWFCNAGVQAGVIQQPQDVALWVRRNEHGALELLGLYDEPSCRVKAAALFAMIAAGKLRRTWATPAKLIQAWEFNELSTAIQSVSDDDWYKRALQDGEAS